MSVKLVVAVTDGDWFDTLRRLPSLAEVNFWAPSPTNFRVLQPGELFLFKLHSPRNVIVGGGIFAYVSNLPCSLAWSAFGQANGANSLQEMRTRIVRYRKMGHADQSDFEIGCRILTQPFFLDEKSWIPVPASWSPNIVSLKSYDAGDGEGLALWEAVHERLNHTAVSGLAEVGARYGEPQLILPRLGQGAFRVVVTDNYNRKCAITRERTLPALDAAHIRPYGDGGAHDPRNGLLLRRDIHSLFDAGYVTVTPDMRFHVSRRIREEFENGRHYYELDGIEIERPRNLLPAVEALKWHNDFRFKT